MNAPWWHPIDQSDPMLADDDDRDWTDLTDSERRARLAAMTPEELVDLCMTFADDAAMWQRKARRAGVTT